ncbi:UDP-N-acetylmuramoyl-L-alanyl-D-glutamate--2,6-diaminopimelate ligase [Candidatus Babeliales bacterium]|nr:UDP-N-acetylmuramoyl-L-alanyl-D-glutamate--2,6-diaminopimelate ligase [Candidatus Babeliales bacterium]
MIPTIYPVTCHTDHVGEGSVFVAINGFKENGIEYIEKAIQKGATSIFSEDLGQCQQLSRKYPKIVFQLTDDSRKTLATLSSEFLGNPSSKLKIIGVTGTKGKTTTAYIIEHILRSAGHKTALIGTIKNKILDREVSADLTTPESDYLHMFFAQCVEDGVTHVIMEVSAHALTLKRVLGLKFDVVCFTNLASEHMDFYKNMQEYFNAKYLLFNQLKPEGLAIINGDNEWGKVAAKELLQNRTQNVILFSQKNYNKIATHNFKIEHSDNHSLLLSLCKGSFEEKFGCRMLFGEFNAYNIISSILSVSHFDISYSKIKLALNSFLGVAGRMQLHTLQNGARAFVDFAHNPSSFEAILKVLRKMTSHLIVVFGCGGDKDKTKRPIMGRMAEVYGDLLIVTDDNPRFEEGKKIIQDILSGILKRKNCLIEPDRKQALKAAISFSKPGSVVAILGKGHESYYFVKGKKIYFDDFVEISKY